MPDFAFALSGFSLKRKIRTVSVCPFLLSFIARQPIAWRRARLPPAIPSLRSLLSLLYPDNKIYPEPLFSAQDKFFLFVELLPYLPFKICKEIKSWLNGALFIGQPDNLHNHRQAEAFFCIPLGYNSLLKQFIVLNKHLGCLKFLSANTSFCASSCRYSLYSEPQRNT